MKLYRSRIIIGSVLGFALEISGAAQARQDRLGGPPPGPPAQTGVYTTVSGTISQLNYDRDAEVEGFLLSNKTLVHLPRRAAARIGDSIHPGDNVQINGYAQASAAGMQTIEAQAVQDRTSGKTFAVPQPGAAAPYSGSGRVQQLNYGPDGTVNGLLFDNGTLATVPGFSATNPSSVGVGGTVGYTGYARTSLSGRTIVDVQSLTINGQTLSMNVGGSGRPGAPPPAPGTRRGGPAAAPPSPTQPPPTQIPAPAAGSARTAPPAGAPAAGAPPSPGRTDQPTRPPSPNQPPRS